MRERQVRVGHLQGADALAQAAENHCRVRREWRPDPHPLGDASDVPRPDQLVADFGIDGVVGQGCGSRDAAYGLLGCLLETEVERGRHLESAAERRACPIAVYELLLDP